VSEILPNHLPSGAGTTYELGRLRLTVKISLSSYTLCEAFEPAGWSAALHRHPTYDETHIVCEGRYECQLGDRRLVLGPGDMMFAPAGTAHSIKNAGAGTGQPASRPSRQSGLGLWLHPGTDA
jgi:mannose-6-phosphate isomerase-like protein (cupin superfamily)